MVNDGYHKLVGAMPPALRGVFPVFLATMVLAFVQFLLGDSAFFVNIASLVGVNVILAVSLNIVNGMTGQFSIGHAGFMAVGAYIAAKFSLVTSDLALSNALPLWLNDQLMFVVALMLGGVTAAVCGFVVGLPSLRLKGDYLAIVTLGFGEIIRVVVQNTDFFGRALGLSGIPHRSTVFMIWFWVFLTVLVARRISESSHGRSLAAIREDEIAAEAMGVNTTAYKVRAFVISAFFAGVAGALFSHVFTINPGSFTFVRSMEIVVMIVAGGLGSTTGAVVAAIALTLLPEAMRSMFNLELVQRLLGAGAAGKVDQVRMPIYGLLLVLIMLLRPQGLFGTRELWHRRKQPRKQPAGTLA